ncbi:MAG TPA: hypothetical protein VEX62_05745 [Candidatus Limnocylindrales bacterium]|nr:hypothetical protein [Candidatus Limnocylindrales bacterium]
MRRIIRTAITAGMLGLVIAGIAVGPALAATPNTASTGDAAGGPDGSIRFKQYRSPFGVYPAPSEWAGLDVRNLSGSGQTQALHAQGAYERGTWLVFVVAVENEGSADRFAIQGSGTGEWDVTYFARGIDITAAVVDGTYQTPELATGERSFIRVKVRLGGAGSGVMRKLTLTSVANPTEQDVVRLRVDYSSCGC